MSGDIQRYLVDTNAVFRLPRNVRSGEPFREVARLPSEVIYEARNYATEYALRTLEYKTTPSVLRRLKDVMSRVPVDDFELIDLYAGEGAADPLLVACALDGAEKRAEVLIGEIYTVVSHDQAVRDVCSSHGIRCIGAHDLHAELTSQERRDIRPGDRAAPAGASGVIDDI